MKTVVQTFYCSQKKISIFVFQFMQNYAVTTKRDKVLGQIWSSNHIPSIIEKEEKGLNLRFWVKNSLSYKIYEQI